MAYYAEQTTVNVDSGTGFQPVSYVAPFSQRLTTGKMPVPLCRLALIPILVILTVAIVGCGRDPEWEYDVSDHWNIAAELIIGEKIAEWKTELSAARDIAVCPNGNIYAAGDEIILVFDVSGRRLGRIALDSEPSAVAVDHDCAIYVGFSNHIEIYTPTAGGDSFAVRAAKWQPLPGAIIKSVAVTGGVVFVADVANRVVLRLEDGGGVADVIGARDPERGIPGIVLPSPNLDVAIGPDGLLKVNNPGRHRVETYTASGHLELSWGQASVAVEGFSGCCNPVSLAVLSDGSVVTAEKGIPRVKLLDGISGELLGVIAAPNAFGGSMRDYGENFAGFSLAVDSNDRIFILDSRTGIIRAYRLGER